MCEISDSFVDKSCSCGDGSTDGFDGEDRRIFEVISNGCISFLEIEGGEFVRLVGLACVIETVTIDEEVGRTYTPTYKFSNP